MSLSYSINGRATDEAFQGQGGESVQTLKTGKISHIQKYEQMKLYMFCLVAFPRLYFDSTAEDKQEAG